MIAAALALVLASAPSPIDALAPSPVLLDERLAMLERNLGNAEAIAVALARVENEAGERLATGKRGCGELRGLAEGAALLGDALREAAQSARAELRRVDLIATDVLVAPILSGAQRRQVSRVREQTRSVTRRYVVARAWHKRHLVPVIRSCPAVPLHPSPGLGAEARGPVAVLVVGDGTLCPEGERIGSVAVLPSGKGCYGGEDCACTPEPLAPAAVLGDFARDGSALESAR